MAHKRVIQPATLPTRGELTSAMTGIGMKFAAEPNYEANIEDTILHAAIEGLERDDFRVLALLVSWFGIHREYVNADRLTRIVASSDSIRVRAFFSGLARWQARDHRFVRMAKIHKGPRIDLLSTGTDFQIRRRGEDERFVGTPLRVPAETLRDRSSDVLPPEELARHHLAYRSRVIIGPAYRGDMWAELTRRPQISTAELARVTYGSFATAWRAKRDFAVLQLAKEVTWRNETTRRK
jgi:hypothetical protein